VIGTSSVVGDVDNAVIVKGSDLPEPLRRDLLRYLLATSAERARLIGELTERNPGMADLLAELEADDDLRARLRSNSFGAWRSESFALGSAQLHPSGASTDSPVSAYVVEHLEVENNLLSRSSEPLDRLGEPEHPVRNVTRRPMSTACRTNAPTKYAIATASIPASSAR
jgi:hypothetical protein